jgi:Ca-activated chloride channel family protein
MYGPKLEVAKQCAKYLARRLAPADQLAVITYDDQVDLVAGLAPVDANAAAHAIDGIYPGGSTNLSGGWLKGLEELRRVKSDVRRVLLLTDGLANVGVTDRDQLVGIASGTKDQAATTTIGFGAGFDEDLLAAIADASGGATYFAENPDDAPAIFAEEFEGLTKLVAQNVSVEIVPSDDVQVVGILNEYPVVQVPGGIQVQLGDAYGGERRRLVFELGIPRLAQLGPATVAHIVLRYTTVGDTVAVHETTIPVVVNLVSANDPARKELDHDVVDEVVILQAARAKKEATELADEGRFDEAREALGRTAREIRAVAPKSSRAAELDTEATRLEDHMQAMSAPQYSSISRKRMRSESWRGSRGRPNRP